MGNTIDESLLHFYKADLTAVDGDTLDAEIDLGFDIIHRVRLRLFGVNAPEKSTEAGKLAKEFVERTLAEAQAVYIQTMKQSEKNGSAKKEKYGRYLVRVIVDEKDLASLIISAGHGRFYDGGKRE